MSTIEPCAQGMIVPKQIGRRVMEIMEERGKAFTQQALAIRIGMRRQTLSMKLRGERDMYLFELRRIAEALHLTVERILQDDTRDDEGKLGTLFAQIDSPRAEAAPNLNEILEIAEKIAIKAVGATERTKALNDLGRAYFLLQRYDDAHKTWMDALIYARKLIEKHGDKESYQLLLSNLLLSTTVKEEYTNLDELLIEIEQEFSYDPIRLSIACYTRAKIAEHSNNIQEAKKQAYKSLDFAQITKSDRRIGKAEATVAHYEFLDKNYEQAKRLLESSMSHLHQYRYNYLTSTVDYVKTLLKLNENEISEKIILETLGKIHTDEDFFLEIKSKMLILLSICNGNSTFAESVLYDSRVSTTIRTLAFKYLKKYCILFGDEKSLMKYTVIESTFGIKHDDILDEEVL